MKFTTERSVPIRIESSPAFVDWFDEKTGEMRGELRDMPHEVYAPSRVEWSEWLRKARRALQLSLRDAAEAWECEVSEVSNLERGRTFPSKEFTGYVDAVTLLFDHVLQKQAIGGVQLRALITEISGSTPREKP